MLTDYYIDLGFPSSTGTGSRGSRARREAPRTPRAGSEATRERRTTQTSPPPESPRTPAAISRPSKAISSWRFRTASPVFDPYADVASEIDAPIEDVLAAVEQLLADGCIKRIGCVVNHVVTGFTNNCMVVWDVPDDELDERGEAVGSLPYVTLCYHRPRRPEQEWEYNLFTMIHGREAEAVDAKIDELAADHLPFTHERLYSTETLKQTGARYEDLVADGE